MIICLETWQAIVFGIFFAFVYCWAGYATSKAFLFSERNIEQRKYIHSLKLLIEQLQNEKHEAKGNAIANGRNDSGRKQNGKGEQ